MISFLIIALIFFFIGRYTATNQDVEKVKKLLKRSIKDRIGVIKRPTAEQIAKRGSKLEETEIEMEKTFDKIVKK